MNNPAASSGVSGALLEKSKLPIFVSFLIFLALPLNVVSYCVLIAMTPHAGRKIPITPKLAAPSLLFDMRAQTKYLSGCDAFDHRYPLGDRVRWNRLN